EDKGTGSGWYWQLQNLPDSAESRYLYALLAGHDFQEGLKNYHQLVYMSDSLGKWDEKMVAFQDMIATRERAYAERLPRVDALLASGALEQLQQRDAALENRLRTIQATHDVAALGTPDERDQWARIQRLEASLNVSAPNAAGALGLPTEQFGRVQQ